MIRRWQFDVPKQWCTFPTGTATISPVVKNCALTSWLCWEQLVMWLDWIKDLVCFIACEYVCVYILLPCTHTQVQEFVCKICTVFCRVIYAWNASPSYLMDICAGFYKQLQAVIVVEGDIFSLLCCHTFFDIASKLKWYLPLGWLWMYQLMTSSSLTPKRGIYSSFPLGLAINTEMYRLTSEVGCDYSFFN